MKRIAIDPGNASSVFAGNSTTIFKTTNGGTSWSDVASGSSRMSTQAVAVTYKTVIALSGANAVTGKNTDGGSTWVNGGLNCSNDFRGLMTTFKTSAGLVAFAAGYHQGSGSTTASIWRSTNGGSSPWTEIFTGSYSSGKINGVIVDPLDSNRIYAFGKKEGNDNLSVSLDGGSTWERVCIPNNSSSSDPEISDLVVDATVGTSSSLNLYASVYNSSTPSQQGVWKSTNAGANWTQLTHALIYNSTNGKAVRVLSMLPYAPSKLFAAGDSNGTYWMRVSDDGGTTWKTITSMTSQVTRILQHPSYASYVYVVAGTGGNTKIYKNTNGGYDSWTDITGSLPTPIYDLRSSRHAGYIYIATNGGIYKLNIKPAAPANLVSSSHNGHPKITWTSNLETDIQETYAYQVYRTLQSCQYISPTKIVCNDPEPTQLVASLSRSTTEYIDNDFGIMVDPELEFYQSTYYVLANDDASLYSDFSVSAVYEGFAYDANKTIFNPLPKEEKPKTFSLDANYPNPFNPSTEITYTLPEDVQVKLIVYNNLGQVASVIVDELQSAGYKSVHFDASNLPSGLYFYRLNAGKFSKTGKMMLVK
jgi:hypothetical protein